MILPAFARKLLASDQTALEQLIGFYPALDWNANQIKQWLASPHYIGFTWVCPPLMKAAALFSLISENEAELLLLASHPQYLRQNSAKDLLHFSFQHLEHMGIESIFLEVRESNHAAKNLYQKNGFEWIAKRKAYYTEPPEDADIYKRILTPLA